MESSQVTAEDVDDLPPTVERLLWLLELESLDRDLFRARSPRHRPNGRLFGGQVAAQALRAATLTVDAAHAPHSLHGYFLRPGLPDRALILQVDRIRDGRSFTTRNVKAIQDGEAIFSLSASFHVDEPAGEFQTPLPVDVPGPDDDAAADRRQTIGTSSSAFDVRQVRPPPVDARGVFESTQRVWVRTRGALPDEDRALHACVLTYASDMGAVLASRKALRIPASTGGMGASLDHALWFHRFIRADDWVLFDLRPVSNSGSRGLVVGTMHSIGGVHGATMTQEALIRESR
ncbi:MAG TPA: acyl-CoA thioesterase domain-containing protein [Acidimicrobiales bacterium]|nr:acyl-CoA thioesterase domain-containing protein [Acidimicrobiales bacterium]